jgi:hypothetical protein
LDSAAPLMELLEKIFVVILLDMELHNEEMQEAEDNCFKE